MTVSLHLDNIIYKLQKGGGASVYWEELIGIVSKDSRFECQYTEGRSSSRFLPVYSNAQVFHSSHFRVPIFSKAKVVSTVYDLTYERGLVNSSAIGDSINILQRKQAIDRADTIICISESTKRELLAIYPSVSNKPIHAICLGNTFNSTRIISINSISSRLQLIKQNLSKFVLYTGVRTNYKNFSSALLGFYRSELPKNGYSLICTGKDFNDDEQNSINKLGLSDRVLITGYVAPNELKYLYQNAFSLLYTSTYEGFGLPPLEAMSCGCPVIAANTSSMPEVIGDSGILIDNIKDEMEIGRALDSLLSFELRNQMIKNGLARSNLFTWEKCIAEHMKVYMSLME